MEKKRSGHARLHSRVCGRHFISGRHGMKVCNSYTVNNQNAAWLSVIFCECTTTTTEVFLYFTGRPCRLKWDPDSRRLKWDPDSCRLKWDPGSSLITTSTLSLTLIEEFQKPRCVCNHQSHNSRLSGSLHGKFSASNT